MTTLAAAKGRLRTERRHSPRSVRGADPIECEILGIPAEFSLLEVGFGGFSLVGPRPVSTNTRYVFRFRFPDRTTALVSAEARHTTQVLVPGRDMIDYVTGFAFRDRGDTSNLAAIDALVDRILVTRPVG